MTLDEEIEKVLNSVEGLNYLYDRTITLKELRDAVAAICYLNGPEGQ